MSKVERYQSAVRELGCALCRHIGRYHGPDLTNGAIELHHVESVRDGLSEYAIVPLHHMCHQGPEGVHGLHRRTFEMRYKLTDVDMLALVAKELA